MEQIGKMIICDRCGKSIFLNRLNDRIFDGGFTRSEQYEDTPQGWERINNKNICPECNEVFKSFWAKEPVLENSSR